MGQNVNSATQPLSSPLCYNVTNWQRTSGNLLQGDSEQYINYIKKVIAKSQSDLPTR